MNQTAVFGRKSKVDREKSSFREGRQTAFYLEIDIINAHGAKGQDVQIRPIVRGRQ